MTTPKLPAITLIHGPKELSTEVANLLSDTIPGVQAHSFMSPLREAARGLFFGGDPSIDIGAMLDKECGLTYQNVETPAHFYAWLANFLAQQQMLFGKDILGQFAVRTVQENMEYFDKIVFDDATRERTEDIRRLIKAFDEENILVVNLVDDQHEPLVMKNSAIMNCVMTVRPANEVIETLTLWLEGAMKDEPSQ